MSENLTVRLWKTLLKCVENNLTATIKLSKTQLSKIIQLGGFFCTFFGALLKSGLSSMKNC